MVQAIPSEELSTPVQCETDCTGLYGVVVYNDQTYPITSSQQTRDQAPVVYGELEWQQPTKRGTVLWRNKNVQRLAILTGVMFLLGFLVYFIFF